ncbi:hypothetical protein L218DRAFT_1082480 [Marasmius fiardii PR-910]|nr:hypothetical protein L218DRAFT_1082480 [Marasmius fiardii PR-910]
MADSFADLWNSSAPTSNSKKPTLGSLSSSNSFNSSSSSNTRSGISSSNDLFSKLSSASGPSSRLGSRAGTPSLGPSQAQTPSQSQSRKAVVGGGDAFDGLFSSTGLSNTSTNMTMAQRAAEAERVKMEKVMKDQAAKAKSNAAWDGLDLLGSSSSSGRSQIQARAPVDGGALDSGSNWEFSTTVDAGPRTTTKASVSVDEDDDWGLGHFASAPSSTSTRNISQTSKSSSQPQAGSLFDLDGFDSGNGNQSQFSSAASAAGRVDSPSHDFDWGNREGRDELLGSSGRDEEDDILGDLGKSVQEVSRRPSRSSSPSSLNSRSKPSGTLQRRSSPPPHILGQLVEMGFSITQAKTALAATDDGEDVQGALDILISNGATEGGSRSRSTKSSPDEENERERERERHDNRRPELHERPVGQRQGSGRDRQGFDRTSTASLRQREREDGAQTQNISEQADKLLAQASTIGLSLFNRANAAWKGAGERVQKAYEEHLASNERPKASGSSTRGPSDGRPKWWREESASDDGNGEPGPTNAGQRRKQRNEERDRECFVDADEQVENPSVTESRKQSKPSPRTEPEPEVDLFSPAPEPVKAASTSANNGVYVSPFRHGRPKPKPQTQPQPTSVSPSPSFHAKSDSLHPSTLVLASPTALRTSAAHKNKGTEFFKLGDFPAAEGEYTKAIDCLPSGQTLLVTLYNNRALVRLKVGNSTGAIEDVGQVIDLVGTGNVGTARGGVEGGAARLDGVDLEVNLGDAIVKAWKRRAEALEGKEKWAEAGRDWERVAGAEWAGQGVRGEGVRGAGRCRRMEKQTQDPEETKVKPPPPARPKPKPKAQTPTRIRPDSEALKSLRQANAAAENEDAEKHALKDAVDARLIAWKGGKENNIRALLASLEMVLWPELGVPKWGMHELISEGQVKVKYMKAIAKVHPDKLSSGNFSVEQKMLAQGVFGALNDAWNSSK